MPVTVRLGYDAIGEELFSARAIALRVQALGTQFSRAYEGKLPLFIGILNAAAPFLADLTRALTIPCEYDFIAVSKAAGANGLRIEKDTTASVEGRHVVLVDDIVDTGVTLRYVTSALLARLPASLAICTLLDRPGRRTSDIEITYHGFDVSDAYVVGYGLDDRGRYRELPSLHARGLRR